MTSPADRSLYRGRFAPSPTGPLHYGSLVAAVASYLDARSQNGVWLVRMEDLDPPRTVPGAATDILHTLERFGFQWDGEVLRQSSRLDTYSETVVRLLDAGLAFPCACSRREIADSSVRGLEGPVYPGTCRDGLPPGKQARSIRMRVEEAPQVFEDALQGRTAQSLEREIGDFVIRRADGCIAYQLAVVLDDHWQGITHVVRGADLLLSTPRQLYLQERLGLPHPAYLHLPVVIDAEGEKLSKQTRAHSLSRLEPVPLLHQALIDLRQAPPPDLLQGTISELWAWAIRHWNRTALRGIRTIQST